jgi:hypothetical protein
MPTSIADIPVGTSVAQDASGNPSFLAVLVTQRSIVQNYSGLDVVNSGNWQSPQAAYVQSGGTWRKVESMKVMQNGSWVSTGPELTETIYKKRVRLSFGGRGFNEGAATSIGQMNLPNDWYVPSGWKMVYCRWSGIYDDVCDGIFLGQKSGANRIGTILARRSNSDYVNENTSIWSWQSIPNFTINNLRMGGASNWECPWLLTPSVSTEGVRCGDDGAVDLHYFPVDEKVIPNSFNQIVSVKRGNSCDTCNHYPYGVMWFEEP